MSMSSMSLPVFAMMPFFQSPMQSMDWLQPFHHSFGEVSTNSSSWEDIGDHYKLTLNHSGFTAEGIKVEVDDDTNVINVKGISRHETKTRRGTSVNISQFSHQTSLPSDAIKKTLQAKLLNDGVLELTVRKLVVKPAQPPSRKVRRIPVL